MLSGVLTAMGPAQADPPDPKAQKKQLDAEIKASIGDLHESYSALQTSAKAYDAATVQLAAVRARYATTQGQLAAARAADVVAATRLKAAEVALATARTEVASGEQQITRSQQGVGRAVRSTYQQNNNLISLSIVLRGASPADLATGIQIQQNVFSVQSNALSRLHDAQAQLVNQKAKVAAAERAVAAERAAARETLKQVRALDARVATQKNQVTASTVAKQHAYASVTRNRAAELSRYRGLVKERNRVTQMLIARARAEKAAEARRRAAARAAAIRAENARAARERRKPRPVPSAPPPSSDGSLFMYPVSARITSPYGQRFHPILRYWKLHDGTDFGAGCGTPIRAATGGIVTDRYYNGGYGNRVFISHGIKRGSHLISVYNHLSRYSTYVGQRVRKGDIIGYVGSTGYSTGCHLHFMIYQDGRVVNPMRWL